MRRVAALPYLRFAMPVLYLSFTRKLSTTSDAYVVEWVFFRCRLHIQHIFPERKDILRIYEKCP